MAEHELPKLKTRVRFPSPARRGLGYVPRRSRPGVRMEGRLRGILVLTVISRDRQGGATRVGVGWEALRGVSRSRAGAGGASTPSVAESSDTQSAQNQGLITLAAFLRVSTPERVVRSRSHAAAEDTWREGASGDRIITPAVTPRKDGKPTVSTGVATVRSEGSDRSERADRHDRCPVHTGSATLHVSFRVGMLRR